MTRRNCRSASSIPRPSSAGTYRRGLVQALTQRRRSARVRALQLARQALQSVKRDGVIVERPCGAQPALDRRAVALGEVVEHVPLSLINDWMSSMKGVGLSTGSRASVVGAPVR